MARAVGAGPSNAGPRRRETTTRPPRVECACVRSRVACAELRKIYRQTKNKNKLLPIITVLHPHSSPMSTAVHPDTGTAAVFVYDGHPGGAGFAERGYAALRRWLQPVVRSARGRAENTDLTSHKLTSRRSVVKVVCSDPVG